MKKFLAVVLGLFVLFAVAALGEGIDLSRMTLDELVELNQKIETEIYTRVNTDSKDMIYPGEYIAGVDIKPGQYEFHCTEAEAVDQQGYIGIARISDKGREEAVSWSYYISAGDIFMFTLDEGMLLGINYCSGILQPADRNWAPE